MMIMCISLFINLYCVKFGNIHVVTIVLLGSVPVKAEVRTQTVIKRNHQDTSGKLLWFPRLLKMV